MLKGVLFSLPDLPPPGCWKQWDGRSILKMMRTAFPSQRMSSESSTWRQSSWEETALGRMASCRAAVPACSPLGEALVKQSLRTQTRKPVAVKHPMTMPGSRHISAYSSVCASKLRLCVWGVYRRKRSFPFLRLLLSTSCTREIILSQRESSWLVELSLLFFPVICLIERSLCGGRDF